MYDREISEIAEYIDNFFIYPQRGIIGTLLLTVED